MTKSQIIGVVLAVVGLVLRWWAYRTLTEAGLPYSGFMEPQRPTEYTEEGPYRWVRHPAYVGSLLLIAGVGIVGLGWGGAVLALPAWPLFALRIHQENRLRGDGWL